MGGLVGFEGHDKRLLSFLGYKCEGYMNTWVTGTGGLEWWGAQCAIKGKAMTQGKGRLEGANSYVGEKTGVKGVREN